FALTLLPLDGQRVEKFAKEARNICKRHDVPFRIAMFTYSDQSLACSLLIEFDPNAAHERDRAHACYADIRELAKQVGGFYYRASIDTMNTFFREKETFLEAARKIKQAMDPKGIISPGRYDGN